MIIEEIRITNFRSYYGAGNLFTLSNRLTLILGDNGDGKTTFFDALEWLFDSSLENKKVSNISAKRIQELSVGETDTVEVSVKFDHKGKKELIKSFEFEKIDKDTVRTFNYKFIGLENIGSQRVQVDGKNLVERCFDAVIRKYCLFKGESQLNVFNSETALKSLVDTFSDVKSFQEYVEIASHCEEKSQIAVDKEARNDTKAAQRARELQAEIQNETTTIGRIKEELARLESAIEGYNAKIGDLERNQEASEQFQDIKKRIEVKKEEVRKYAAMIECNYSGSLLDKMWILRPFKPIFDEYRSVASSLSLQRRQLEREYIEESARAQGANEAITNIQKLANGVSPLPWNLPDKETMEEMIREEVCKVCGRPAPKGSAAYEFMVNKLQQYLKKVEEETRVKLERQDEKPLFVNEYINELRERSIQMGGDNEKWLCNIAVEIAERLEFIQSRKRDLEKAQKDLREAEEEKARLLLQAQGVTEDMLDVSFDNYKGYTAKRTTAVANRASLLKDLEFHTRQLDQLKDEYANIDTDNKTMKLYQRVHSVLDVVKEAFVRAKDNNIEEFLLTLEKRANEYMEVLNENDFRGIIRIIRKMDGGAEIKLYNGNKTLVANPNTALETTMYMSVLFAISNITTLKRDEDYPLVFDAPTSSFGELKEDIFYNIIDTIDKQCIIVTKDLLIPDAQGKNAVLNEAKIKGLTCSVYRIKKAEGFGTVDQDTIQITITKVK